MYPKNVDNFIQVWRILSTFSGYLFEHIEFHHNLEKIFRHSFFIFFTTSNVKIWRIIDFNGNVKISPKSLRLISKTTYKLIFYGNETQTSSLIQFFQIKKMCTFGFESERASGSLRERSIKNWVLLIYYK